MNCDEFQNVVTDLARDQMMEATARTQALAHSAHCDECAQSLENERWLTSGLRTLAGQMESLAAGPQVETHVLAAFRSRSTVAPIVVHSRRWYWAGAAAAAVLLLFGVAALRGWVASSVTPQGTEARNGVTPTTPTLIKAQVVPAPVPQPIAAVRGSKRNLSLVQSPVASRPNQPVPVSDSTNSEIATDFFPVGDGRAVNLQDGGQLMRVEVPRSTMARFGLPVNFERSNERVKADVLVSTDGLARAIRFVQ